MAAPVCCSGWFGVSPRLRAPHAHHQRDDAARKPEEAAQHRQNAGQHVRADRVSGHRGQAEPPEANGAAHHIGYRAAAHNREEGRLPVSIYAQASIRLPQPQADGQPITAYHPTQNAPSSRHGPITDRRLTKDVMPCRRTTRSAAGAAGETVYRARASCGPGLLQRLVRRGHLYDSALSR